MKILQCTGKYKEIRAIMRMYGELLGIYRKIWGDIGISKYTEDFWGNIGYVFSPKIR